MEPQESACNRNEPQGTFRTVTRGVAGRSRLASNTMDHPNDLLSLDEIRVRLRIEDPTRTRKRILATLRRLGIPTREIARQDWRVRRADLDAAIERHFRPPLSI